MLKYVSGSTKETFCLSDNKVKGRIRKAGFYASEWNMDETSLEIGSYINKFRKKAAAYSLIIDFLGNKSERAKNANKFFDMTEEDVLNKTPGRLFLNEYYIECFVIKKESGGRDDRQRMVQMETKIYAPYPFWVSENTYTFQNSGIFSTDNKRYPGQYQYRYANGTSSGYIMNPHFAESNFKMIIYGPVTNPMVSIGETSYLVNIVLEEGEYLEIESKNRTITKAMKNGERVNAFHNRAKGKDFFQKISSGRQTISWTGKFYFELTIYEERGEPRWAES